jgi:hypothetical protein
MDAVRQANAGDGRHVVFVLEPDARSALSFAFFASSQSKYFSGIRDLTMCA